MAKDNVEITVDSYYPFYDVIEYDADRPLGRPANLSNEEWAAYRAMKESFDVWQDRLRKLYRQD